MKLIFLTLPALSLIALSGASATPQAAAADSHNPVIKDSTVRRTSAPATGVSSFTEDQARGRITKAGFTSISSLTTAKGGAWMGTAMKGKKRVRVMLDYKGNVTAR